MGMAGPARVIPLGNQPAKPASAAGAGAAYEHGSAPVLGLITLLDGGEEGVHIDVKDGSRGRRRTHRTAVRRSPTWPTTASSPVQAAAGLVRKALARQNIRRFFCPAPRTARIR